MTRLSKGVVIATSNGNVRVVHYESFAKVTVVFDDATCVTVDGAQLLRGSVKNPNRPSVYGKGFPGLGEFTRTNCPEIYQTWRNMLQRCYSPEYQLKRPTYVGCRVAKRWLNFQNFVRDYRQMVGYQNEGWQLDKDLIVYGNKKYSRNNCCLVPPELNSLLTDAGANRGASPLGVSYHKPLDNYRAQLNIDGKPTHIGYFDTEAKAFRAYKRAKERQIRKVAKRFKRRLDLRVYESLRHFKVQE